MKLMHITMEFQYADMIESILDEHDVCDYVRYPMMLGKDRQGKHHGSKVFPGNLSVLQALVHDEDVDSLLEDLRAFQIERNAHRHLRAVVVAVEAGIVDDGEEAS
ncbi:MAG: PG0541 family transporter-associated protein [Myxococcota bacterium]